MIDAFYISIRILCISTWKNDESKSKWNVESLDSSIRSIAIKFDRKLGLKKFNSEKIS